MKLLQGDCFEVMQELEDNSVDLVLTDPPYGLKFMGKKWDYEVPQTHVWYECLRVLKPGGHLLAFAGTRTYHRMACRIEDAGFEIRDMLAWLYGSGMPKSFNLKRLAICDCIAEENAIQYYHEKTKHNLRPLRIGDLSESQHNETERGEVLFPCLPQQNIHSEGSTWPESESGWRKESSMEGREVYRAEQGLCNDPQPKPPEGETERVCTGAHSGGGKDAGKAASGRRGGTPQKPGQSRQLPGESTGVFEPLRTLDDRALHGRGKCPRCGKLKKEFAGCGSALKPALEPITMARKPLVGTVAANVLEYGTGALNIDACRVGTDDIASLQKNWDRVQSKNQGIASTGLKPIDLSSRAPSGRWPANLLHDGSEEVLALFPMTGGGKARQGHPGGTTFGGSEMREGVVGTWFGDSGSAARFFYCAKASKRERTEGNHHPTVKPIALMEYLVKLASSEGQTILDPFMGSGTTGIACQNLNRNFIGIEMNEEYFEIARNRINNAVVETLF